MLSIKKIAKQLILGNSLPQEYLCVGKEELSHPLNVLVSWAGNSLVRDIADHHLFLGYKPLIIGIPASQASELHAALARFKKADLLFYPDDSKNKPVAELQLHFAVQKDFDSTSLFLFEGLKGSHHFIPLLYQFTNNLRYRLAVKRENNIMLKGNLYDQVRIAYAVPRVISIVSLGNGSTFNMFPTDLNGAIDDDHYVISLRHAGKASEQVNKSEKICIATVEASYFREAYDMGKNHWQPMKSLEAFHISTERSELLKLPLPPATLSYRELETMDSMDMGIHRLYFFKVLGKKILRENTSTLSHLHCYYARWREKRHYQTNYFLR